MMTMKAHFIFRIRIVRRAICGVAVRTSSEARAFHSHTNLSIGPLSAFSLTMMWYSLFAFEVTGRL